MGMKMKKWLTTEFSVWISIARRILILLKNLSSGSMKLFAQFVKVDRNVYKTANKSASMTNQILLSILAIKQSYLHDLSHVFKQINTTMRWKCMSKALRFVQITAKHQDFPFPTVFLIIKTSFQNISITLLRFCLNFTNIKATVLEKNAPVN